MTENMSGAARGIKVGILLVLASVLAGCVGTDSTPDADDVDQSGGSVAPWAVVALVDTGINPYHVDFRLDAEWADVHPSEYIPGYPDDVPTVNLTLDAEDVEAALDADADVWDGLESQQPYWFRGTKVTGISVANADPGVGPVFSTGHGTMVASKAGGVAHSMCPTCHVVAVQGFNGNAVTWAADQAWIDVQSNSWGPLPAFAWADRVVPEGDAQLNVKMEAAAARQPVFVAAGNGLGGALGVVGFPSPTDSTSGPPGVIAIGGNDNGKTTMWTAWFPHLVADACANWAAVGNTMDDYSDSAGGGTSAASPYTAGGAARLVLEARRVLQTTEPRALDDGVVATAGANATLPASGPLADGDFTIAELKDVLFHTASPRPQGDAASGAECSAASPYWTGVPWASVPDDVTIYPWVGYGSVETASIDRAIAVIEGTGDPFDRPVEDDLYAEDQRLRATYHHAV